MAVTADSLTMKEPAGPVRRGGAAHADPFVAARRHSARVRFLRKAIPVGCALAIVGAVAIGRMQTLGGAIPEVSLGPMSVSGAQITMEAPRLTGFRKDNRGYEVTAARASQDIRKPQEITLFDLAGRMEAEKGTFSRIAAARGLYDTGGEKLALSGGITIITDGGYRIAMATARVAFKEGSVQSDDPVTVTSGTGTIESQTLEVMDGGAVIRFAGRVVSIIHPDAANSVPPVEDAPTTEGGGAATPAPAAAPLPTPAQTTPAQTTPAPARGAPAPPARVIPLNPQTGGSPAPLRP